MHGQVTALYPKMVILYKKFVFFEKNLLIFEMNYAIINRLIQSIALRRKNGGFCL